MRVFFPEFDISIGSQRIPFFVYKDALVEFCNITPVYGDSLSSADIVFSLSGTGLSQYVSAQYPDIPIVTFKPHLEEIIKSSSSNLLYSLSSYFQYKISSNKSFRNRVIADNLCSSLLIADTPRLHRFFTSRGYNALYLPLIDCFFSDIKPYQLQDIDNTFHILFHGNLAHFNSNIDQLLSVIKHSFPSSSTIQAVHIHCVSRFANYTSMPANSSFPIIIHRHPFDLNLLHSLLKSCHLGWAPNLYNVYNSLFTRIFKVLFTSSTQKDDILSVSKFSTNFGRSLLFAQYNLPFITHPCEESSFFYNSISNSVFYDDYDSFVYLMTKYINVNYRHDVSSLIQKNFSYSSLLREYTHSRYDKMLYLTRQS